LRRRHGVGQLFGAADEPHAATTSAGGGLDQEGEPDRSRAPDQNLAGAPLVDDQAGQHRHACRSHRLLGPHLVTHDPHRLGSRADPDEPGPGAGFRQRRVLGKESVAGMERVGPGPHGQRHQRVGTEVGLGQRLAREGQREVGLPDIGGGPVLGGVDRDRFEPAIVGPADDATGDLAPVGHQDPLQAPRRH
jgi:hypothetical protein